VRVNAVHQVTGGFGFNNMSSKGRLLVSFSYRDRAAPAPMLRTRPSGFGRPPARKVKSAEETGA
jgi:hypothetical protein